MTRLDEFRLVVLLACENSDRDNAEQRALLRVAMRVDNELNQQTNTNPRWKSDRRSEVAASRLVDVVLGTDGDFERRLPRSMQIAIQKTWRHADDWDRAHGLRVSEEATCSVA